MRAYKPVLFCLFLLIGILLVSSFKLKTQGKTTARPQSATITISDTTFNPADWSVIESSEGGASQTNAQALSGGNPGAFRSMEHVLPSPPSPTDVGSIEVMHLYESARYDPGTQGAIDYIDYSEDTALLSLPWSSASIVSFAALAQDGRVYRSSDARFVLVTGTTAWTSGSMPGLTATEFVALDGSDVKPDFSDTGGPITFGYWRTSSRVGDIPVPYNQNLPIQHGIDNFSVTVHPLTAVTCTLDPPAATKSRGEKEHTVTVTVRANGAPIAAQEVTFRVESGPHRGYAFDIHTTNADGLASFTYVYELQQDQAVGVDIILATGTHQEGDFSCRAQITWTNAPPVTEDDVLVVEAQNTTTPQRLPVLDNDSDPDRDAIKISSFTQPLDGKISHGLNNDLQYTGSTPKIGTFKYTISDDLLSDEAAVTLLPDCGCALTCSNVGKFASSGTEAIDLALLRRVRDEVFRLTEHGTRYTDIYYDTTPEIAWILILGQPELGRQAVRMVEELQPALRDLLDGDGSAVITQAQIDSVSTFFDNLSAAGSGSLQQLIANELTRVGALGDYVGLPVRDVLTTVLGESVGTAIGHEAQPAPTDFVLQQNFPNPFEDTTEIRYVLSRPTQVSLTIYNIQGQKVRTLIQESQNPGVKSVIWNGLDDSGFEVSSGVYVFRLQTPTYQATKTMVLRK